MPYGQIFLCSSAVEPPTVNRLVASSNLAGGVGQLDQIYGIAPMFRYIVRLSRNGIGFDYEVVARTSYEAKETAERFYPLHKAIYAKKV